MTSGDAGAAPKVDIGRVPSPVDPELFFGRDHLLGQLDAALLDPNIEVVQIVADGGFGKSTLVWHWIQGRLAASDHASLFDWSFYAQGQSPHGAHSQDFIEAAARYFDIAVGTGDARRASTMVERIALQHLQVGGILVMDGLEPLQYPPTQEGGAVRDDGVRRLLQQVLVKRAQVKPRDHRLIVITTRWSVPEVRSSHTIHIKLEHLADDDGVNLLSRFRLRGTDARLHFNPPERFRAECRLVTQECNGHPLALVLLGSYLIYRAGGDLARRSTLLVPSEPQQTRAYRHARRIMRSYEEVLGSGTSELGNACRQTLVILGLFDRPAPQTIIEDMIRADPPIANVTDGLTIPRYNEAVRELRRLHLATPDEGEDSAIAVHPLIRQYFSESLYHRHRRAFHAAHRFISGHIAGATPARPSTPLEMLPLFHATTHACKATRYRDAFQALYLERIMRGNEMYAVNRLGLFAPVVAVLAHFFHDGSWSRFEVAPTPDQNLTLQEQLILLTHAGMCLIAVRGYAADEVGETYAAAQDLVGSVGDTQLVLDATYGSWKFHLVRADLVRTEQLAADMLEQSRTAPTAYRLLALRARCTTCFYLGRFVDAVAASEEAIPLCGGLADPSSGRPCILDGETLITCRSYGALALWNLGRPAEAQAMSESSVASARELNQPHTLALALFFDLLLTHFTGDIDHGEYVSEELFTLTSDYHMTFWGAAATVFRGWVLFQKGFHDDGLALTEQGIAAWQGTGARLLLPYWMLMLGRMLLTRDPPRAREVFERLLQVADATGESWSASELLCIRATQLTPDDAAADRLLAAATEAAAAQHATPRVLNAVELRVQRLVARSAFADATQLIDDTGGQLQGALDSVHRARLNALASSVKDARGSSAR